MGEARLSAYEAFCGIAAKYEAPQMRYEAKPFQASCFFALKSRQKNGGESGIRRIIRYGAMSADMANPLFIMSSYRVQAVADLLP